MSHLWRAVVAALSTAILISKGQSQFTCFTYEEASLSFSPTIFFDFEDTESQMFLDKTKGVKAFMEGKFLKGESLLANCGDSMYFDGGHLLIQSISQQSFLPTSFSITFWTKPLFSRDDEHNQGMQIFSTVQMFEKDIAGISISCTRHNQWAFQIGNAEFSPEISGGFCGTDQLSFVVAAYDASTEEATLYVNGELVASRIVQFHGNPITQILLGANSVANGNMALAGMLDGFAVYSQTLEDGDIQLLYYSGFCPEKENSEYVLFEDDAAQDASDCYGNAARLLNPIILFDFQQVEPIIYDEIKELPGELEGNFSVIASPVPAGGAAFYFNGVDTDVYIEQTSYFNFFTTRSFSIVFWAKPILQNVDQSMANIPVVSNKKNNLGLSIWCTSSHQWVFFIGAGTVLNAFQGGECSSGKLSLVVAAFDDETQNAALYVNGDLVSSGSVAGGYSAADTPLYFGSGIEPDGRKGFFEGVMDGVTIFPRSLTPAEVETLAISANCQGTPAPSVSMTPGPTPQPTPVPSAQPTPMPTPAPSAQPTPQLTPVPTPTAAPSATPEMFPSSDSEYNHKKHHTHRPTPKSGSTTPMPTEAPTTSGAFENPETINFLLLNDAYKKGHDIYLNALSVGSEGEAVLNKKWVQEVGIPATSITLNFEMLIGSTTPATTCAGSEMIWSYGADNHCLRSRAEFGNEEKCHGVDVGFIIGSSRAGVHVMKDGIVERERYGAELLFNTWMEVTIGLKFNGTHHFLTVAVDEVEYFPEPVLFTHEDLRDYDDLGKMGFFGSTGFMGTKLNIVTETETSLNKVSGSKQAGGNSGGAESGGKEIPAAGCSPVEFAIRSVLFTDLTAYTSSLANRPISHSMKSDYPYSTEITSFTFVDRMQQAEKFLPESAESTMLQFLEGLRDHMTGFSMYGQLPFLLLMASFPTGYAGYQVLNRYFSSHTHHSYLPIREVV